MIYDYPHPAPEWPGIFEAGVCARESLPMKRDAGSGRPLLIAAMELLTDAPAQTIMSAFRASAGDPRERATTAHYQRLIWRDLRPSLQNGRLVALGFVDGAEELQAIPPHFYNNATPDFINSMLSSHGLTYTSVRIFEASEKPDKASSESVGGKSKGGRLEKHDWLSFDREVVRIGWQDGFKTRRELTTRMRTWVSETWKAQPDESMIRKRVRDLCPEDVSAE
jgi:hypothetical protein